VLVPLAGYVKVQDAPGEERERKAPFSVA